MTKLIINITSNLDELMNESKPVTIQTDSWLKLYETISTEKGVNQ